MAHDQAKSPTITTADNLGDRVVTWGGIGWDGFETVLEVQGESRRPKLVYLDGDLTFIERDLVPLDGDQVVVLRGVGREGFEKLLALPETAAHPRFLYLNGDVYLMAPSPIHERWVDRLGTFVRELVVELDIPCIPTRETLFKRDRDEAGVQPDDSFYLANLGPIVARGREAEIDLQVDPPPDLVIEFVHTNDARPAVETLGRLGVPEVWLADRKRLRFLVRDEAGHYRESERSLAFPFLTVGEVFGWVARTDLDLYPEWVRALRRWIAEVVVPRIQAG